jgi:hypothetical protein
MSGIYDPIDVFVSDLKRNTRFLDNLLFPKIGIFVGTLGVLIALALLIK